MRKLTLALVVLTLFGCGDDGSNNTASRPDNGFDAPAIDDQAGPMSVSGSQWTTGVKNFDGFELELVFEFTDEEIIASSICDRTTTVTARAPISYTYSVETTEGSADETVDGDAFCNVSIEPGEFNFEQSGQNLLASAGDTSALFEGAPGNRGVYGEWSLTENGTTITWWMGNNELVVRAVCDNGLTAQTRAPAIYKSFFAVEVPAEAGDEFCNVSLSPEDLEYRIENNTLTLMKDGEEFELMRR